MILYIILLVEMITSVYVYSIYGYQYEKLTLELLCSSLILFIIVRVFQIVLLYILNNYTVMLEIKFINRILKIYTVILIGIIIINITMVI